MAKRHLEQYDKNGNKLDIYLNDDEVLVDGQTLADKLSDMEEDIEEAGQTSGDGTVTGVQVGSTVYEPTNGVVDLSTPIGNKVDKETGKGLSTNDYTDADKTKLANIEAGAEVNVISGIKANGASETLPVENGIVTLPPAASPISPATATPSMDGTAAVGSSEKYAREDHVHPHDTSKQDTISDLSTIRSGAAAGATAVQPAAMNTALHILLSNIHIGVNGNWWIGPETDPNNDTGVKAQGPQGNCNISDASQLVAILVNDLTTGGAGNILTAEMGKVLKTAISTLIDSMGEYCFPNGRPTLSFEGPKCDVTQNLTDVDSDFSALRVDEGGLLEITLTPSDNLHVFLTGDVTVEMPLGNDITSTAWNESTGIVHIAAVTDDVVITAKSSTYISTGLVFNLDAKNGLDLTNNKWADLVGGVEFDLTDVALNQAGTAAVFNGSTSKGVTDSAINYLALNGTIEAVFTRSSDSVTQPVFQSRSEKGFNISSWLRSSDNKKLMCWITAQDVTGLAGKPLSLMGVTALNIAASFNETVRMINGSVFTGTTADTWMGYTNDPQVVIGFRKGSTTDSYLNGTISCIRIYNNKKLTEAEMSYNHQIDKKRFNLAQ